MPGWTVVVSATVTYDLKEAIQADLNEVRTALTAIAGADVQVHVWLHGPAYKTPKQWSWAPRPGGAARSAARRVVGELTPGPLTLRDFVKGVPGWTTQRRRLLVLWGHGAGAFAGPVRANRREDEAARPEVATAGRVVARLAAGSKRTTLLAPDIIGYDACRMATVANVLEYAAAYPKAVFIGSMVPEPASGWPYFQLLEVLSKDWDRAATAAAVVEAYSASVDADNWCMIALDLAKIRARSGLAGRLRALTRPPAPGAIEFFDAAAGADILDDTDTADLGALMRRLDLAEPNAAALGVRQALLEATIARRAAGALAGRDGLAVAIGLPTWGNASAGLWLTEPTWSQYLPGLEAAAAP